jgi:hypothetical protein
MLSDVTFKTDFSPNVVFMRRMILTNYDLFRTTLNGRAW